MPRAKKNQITVNSLCFGTFAKALQSAMPESYGEQIAITQLLLDYIIENKNLVDRFKKPIVVTDKMASELFSFKTEIHQKIKEAAASKTVRGVSRRYFDDDVVPGISPNLVADLLSNLAAIISNDESIPAETKESLLAKATNETIGDFLADTFLYAVQRPNSHTNNADNGLYSKKDIWEASKRDYISSRSEGNRFANLNILSKLLPRGYVVQDRFKEYAKTEDGDIVPLQELLDEYAPHDVSVIGEGGIGKTTFLLKLLEGVFEKKFDNKAPVPIFIELNRCPGNMGEWYSAINKKTNFIARYIASQLVPCELEDAPGELLTFIDEEFKKKSKVPNYLILLDGFNEVNRNPGIDKHGNFIGSTLRELLSTEIKALMNCPNVRVIMTSRKMDMVYFSGETKNIELTGVKKEDIRGHLQDNNYREADINAITASFKLMECLRIPLFLCMFTAGGISCDDKPTTRGEILYTFFNNAQGMYTERMNAERISAPSRLTMTQTWFILDFVLPHIGWTFEYTDFFYSDKAGLIESINDFFTSEDEEVHFWNKKIIAFPDYETESKSLSDIKDELVDKGKDVLDCIVNTLGVMYRDKNFQYYFIHHHVRDYFAGIYEIQRMRMAAVFWEWYNSTKKHTFINDAYLSLYCVNSNIWSEPKRNFIGEILREHKNAPELVDEKWTLPIPTEPRQELLRTVLDIFRLAERLVHRGVMNVIDTMKDVRGILAGENFSNLNLSECRLHGVNCSIGRGDSRLSADFTGAVISDDTFQVEGHLEEILEFAYSFHGDNLFTMSAENTVKRWDVETGRCLNTIKLDNSVLHEGENLIQCRFVVSNNDESFLTSGFEYDEETKGHFCFVQEYDWKHNRMEYRSLGKFRDINIFNYSPDDTRIVVVYSHNNLFIYEKGEGVPIFHKQLEAVGNVIDAQILSENEVLLFYTVGSVFVEETPDDEEDVTYQIAIYNTVLDETQIIHSYTVHVDWDEDDAESVLSPPYCVSSRNETVVFWEDGQLKKLTLENREIEDVAYSHEEPDFIVFEKGADNLLLLYFDTCVTYNLEDGYELSIHQYEDLNYQLAGKHSVLSLLMFDEYLNPYEWNLLQSRPIEKYQYSKRSITGVFVKSATKELIVTYDNDSLVVLNEQGDLVESLNYGKGDAQTCLSLYSNKHDCLIFLYENDSYEYVECCYLTTGQTRYAYFDSVEKNKIKGLTLPISEDRIFCEFERKVTEIDLATLNATPVFDAGENETVQAVYHDADTDLLRIIVTYIPKGDSDSQQRPRAYEYRKISDGTYARVAWYELPHLSRTLLNEFSPFYKEVYTQPRSADDSIKLNSEYFLNFGIFFDYDDVITEAMSFEKHIEYGDKAGQTETAYMNPHKANYVIGDIPALVTYLVEDNEVPLTQLLHINEEENTMVVIDNKDLLVLKYEDGEYYEICRASPLGDGEYGNPAEGAEIQGEYVYFWRHPNLLYSFDIETGSIRQYDGLIPGLVVLGCDFRNSGMSTAVKDMLNLHGGKTGHTPNHRR